LAARPRRRTFFLPQLLLGAVAAAGFYLAFTLAPRATRLGGSAPDPRIVFGAYHIHSNRSDGTGTPDEIAAAAARAGLQFVILADHGDGTRQPDPPQYRSGVLTIDAGEMSSTSGHVVALGMQRASAYPVAGEARDVIEDIHRLGGWAVIAHPDSPRAELRWRGGNMPGAVYEGLEWLNLDSEWRDETPSRLLGTLARYFFRGPETIASLIQRPTQTLRRWDIATRTRPVVGLAALDAHARVPWRTSREDARDRTLAALPTYRQVFRTATQAVVLDRTPAGDASSDAALLLGALRAGRTYSVVSGFAVPGQLTYQAAQGASIVEMGQSLSRAEPHVSFTAQVNDPTARLSLVHNGAEIATARGQLNYSGVAAPGAYRLEAYRAASTVPWIVSNPIYGPPGDRLGPPAPVIPPATRHVPLPGEGGWAVEHSPTSSSTFTQQGSSTHFSFGLGPGVAFDQFSALAATIGSALAAEGFDRVRFTVRADRPMRFSVQLRLPGGRRWRHSVYADETPRDVELLVQDFQPADGPSQTRPIVARLRSVLFVMDTLNAFPGTKGTITLTEVALGVGNAER
jgi:hypothetical protein